MEYGQYFIQLIEKGDACSLLFLIGIFCYIGNLAVTAENRLRNWGLRIAVVVFVGFVAYGAIKIGAPDADALTLAALRALAAGGLALGASWIVLPMVAFVYRHFARAAESARQRAIDRQLKRDQRIREREIETQRRRQTEEAQRLEAERAAESERLAAENERRRREQQAEQRKLAKIASVAQTERDNVRFACELLYDRLTPEQQEQFPRHRFETYFSKYLSDSQQPEQVAARAEQIQAMIRECFDPSSDRSRRFTSIKEIADLFHERRQEIESLEYDDAMKEALVALINKEEQAAVRKFLSP